MSNKGNSCEPILRYTPRRSSHQQATCPERSPQEPAPALHSLLAAPPAPPPAQSCGPPLATCGKESPRFNTLCIIFSPVSISNINRRQGGLIRPPPPHPVVHVRTRNCVQPLCFLALYLQSTFYCRPLPACLPACRTRHCALGGRQNTPRTTAASAQRFIVVVVEYSVRPNLHHRRVDDNFLPPVQEKARSFIATP
ncbi:hypothetical protein MPTK2_8g04640 [Marchantia polymorpha subsp. ruderalis]